MAEKRFVSLKWFIPIFVLACLAIGSGFFFWRSRHIDDFTRTWVVRSLSERFDTEVALGDLHVSAFPELRVVGRNLTIYHRERNDLPFIHIDSFTFHLGVLGIFRVPHEIRSVSVQNMTITIPPRQEKHLTGATKSPSTPAAKTQEPLPAIVVDEILCDNTTLVILPKKAGKLPLEWDIHALNLYHAGANQSMEFHGTLTNAK